MAERDEEIVKLFFARDEAAIGRTREEFAPYYRKIAFGLLRNAEDVEECENDLLLAAWKSIPPHRPENLAAYLGKLTRRISIDRIKRDHRQKRQQDGGGAEALEEFSQTIPCPQNTEEAYENQELSSVLSAFLRTINESERKLFVRRYFFGDSVEELCAAFHKSKSGVKMQLLRTREKLAQTLRKEGYDL